MSNRPQGEGLEGLTPERLLDLSVTWRLAAHVERQQAGSLTVSLAQRAELLRSATEHEQTAALCRAVANAYKRIRASAEDGHDLCIGAIGDRGVCTYWLSNESDEPFAWAQHETLAAALASIHPEAGGTA